jgi:hypothetical protein
MERRSGSGGPRPLGPRARASLEKNAWPLSAGGRFCRARSGRSSRSGHAKTAGAARSAVLLFRGDAALSVRFERHAAIASDPAAPRVAVLERGARRRRRRRRRRYRAHERCDVPGEASLELLPVPGVGGSDRAQVRRRGLRGRARVHVLERSTRGLAGAVPLEGGLVRALRRRGLGEADHAPSPAIQHRRLVGRRRRGSRRTGGVPRAKRHAAQ